MKSSCCICERRAVGAHGGNTYCAEHRPSVGPPVAASDVECARLAMADGASLKDTAQHLQVMSADLDLALWNNFGRAPAPRRYRPDFDA